MKQRSRDWEKLKRDAFFLVVLVTVAIVGILQVGCTKPGAPIQSSTPQPAKTPTQPGASAVARPDAPQCAPGTSSRNPSSLMAKGDHQVILSWKGSAPADARHSAAIGYCVYRGSTPRVATLVGVNSRPFAGTSCTDDLVGNGKKYFYKVRAIDINGNTSDFSNVASAIIPHSKKPKSVGSVPPLCRGVDTLQ